MTTTKKKPYKKRKKKKKQGSGFLKTMGRGLLWAIGGFALFALAFTFYDCKHLIKNTDFSVYEEEIGQPEPAPAAQLAVERKEQVIRHEGFTVSYNSDYKIANWVAWELTREKARANQVERTNRFERDPKVRGGSASYEDYRGSGYDRGHLAPAGDMKWSRRAMEESFYLSNICPQDRRMNAGIWNDLEMKCRNWAAKHGAIHIITGPVITDNMNRIGRNRVAVPDYFYKVIYNPADGKHEGIGFIMENREYTNRSLGSLATTIDDVEAITGIDFFHALPDSVQQTMESKVNLKAWGL